MVQSGEQTEDSVHEGDPGSVLEPEHRVRVPASQPPAQEVPGTHRLGLRQTTHKHIPRRGEFKIYCITLSTQDPWSKGRLHYLRKT